jgi:hypothetical protein
MSVVCATHVPITDGECIYCAYDLTGLPDEARCPECGRQSIPTTIRQEVQEVFDSPRRLYREALRVVGKHPPGWYWSLDRPGDLRRSFRFALINLMVCFAIAGGAWVLADSLGVESVTMRHMVDPTGNTPAVLTQQYRFIDGVFGQTGEYVDETPREYRSGFRMPPGFTTVRSSTSSIRWRFLRGDQWLLALFPAAWIVCMWLLVVPAGMWTQIRKGLPRFAVARRTVVAAGNAETCRLPLQGLIVALVVALESVARLTLCDAAPNALITLRILLQLLMAGGVCAFWIGPLRSDYSGQLIRTRLHAVRMYLMYVLILPFVLTALVIGALEMLLHS